MLSKILQSAHQTQLLTYSQLHLQLVTNQSIIIRYSLCDKTVKINKNFIFSIYRKHGRHTKQNSDKKKKGKYIACNVFDSLRKGVF